MECTTSFSGDLAVALDRAIWKVALSLELSPAPARCL
jgi:hypothetical protein